MYYLFWKLRISSKIFSYFLSLQNENISFISYIVIKQRLKHSGTYNTSTLIMSRMFHTLVLWIPKQPPSFPQRFPKSRHTWKFSIIPFPRPLPYLPLFSQQILRQSCSLTNFFHFETLESDTATEPTNRSVSSTEIMQKENMQIRRFSHSVALVKFLRFRKAAAFYLFYISGNIGEFVISFDLQSRTYLKLEKYVSVLGIFFYDFFLLNYSFFK